MGALRKQMDGDLVVRGMAVRTREAYLGAVAGLAKYYGRPPDRIDEAEVQRYLLYLIEERKLAWASCNVVAQGRKFFYSRHAQAPRSAVRHSEGTPAPEVAADSRARGGRAFDRAHPEPEAPGNPDDDLRRGIEAQ